MATSLFFPSIGLQVLVCLVYFLGISTVAHCVSRRLPDIIHIRQTSWTRLLIPLVFIDSWLFLFTSGILIFGVGLETSLSVCMTGIFLCIVFYTSSKVLLYIVLMEKVHVVWSTSHNTPRMKSPVYLVGLGTILLYVVVAIVLIIGRVHYLSAKDGYCYIGLKFYASLTLLTYDLSAGVALAMSTVNIAILTAWHGKERGWMCLACCTTDIIFNALALFWVTKDAQSNSTPGHNLESANGPDITISGGRRLGLDASPVPVMMKTLKHDRDNTSGLSGVTVTGEFSRESNDPIFRGQSVQVVVTTVKERDDDSYDGETSVKRTDI
ncbi:hypothetical protein K435DRAFT_801318 [Dendrothele bispora CBS 962.96]|uniref:G-protein coupled receptors family 3 profile domain-containing protein n=1 Tax=Dendrothele bispora (strain CBS 962.96) TaxID=1314807 RepID=A0A4S8LPT7_DENBC|nr:hypothetical protein K435DRAFT_801318 [Dendrothele bispora CBS 962.96]